eukprot:TRINITY_DN2441_c0_g1_i2.p1 TRINITY_DN2441_c0_g1~~TRINITY_DN2441_c0_g1_i2.p1  ORF type:complete len:210 (+),score=30.33 TRINITY_DN2441_c0_g1_i2:268-897(+)
MSEEGKERVWKEQCIRRGWERSMGQASTDPITIPARLEYTACRGPHYEDTSAHTPAARWARTKMENIAARLELRPRGGPEKSQPARERATVQFDAESAGWNVVEPPTAQQSSRFYQRSSAAYGTRLGSSSCRAAGRPSRPSVRFQNSEDSSPDGQAAGQFSQDEIELLYRTSSTVVAGNNTHLVQPRYACDGSFSKWHTGGHLLPRAKQ